MKQLCASGLLLNNLSRELLIADAHRSAKMIVGGLEAKQARPNCATPTDYISVGDNGALEV